MTRNAERLIVAAALALVLVGVLVMSLIAALVGRQLQRCGGGAAGGAPTQLAETEIPARLLPIYRAAEQRYGVPWNVLAAINRIETDFGRRMATSSAGAIGWMQFMPATWARYATDGDGDGEKDPDNPADAIFSAARYLRASGADRDLAGAIFAYNHAAWYVQDVLQHARRYAHGEFTVGVGAACDVPTGPAEVDRAVTLYVPRSYAELPQWAMAGGRTVEQVDARILPDVRWILRRYRLRVSAAREPGHMTHGDGTAVDLVPAGGTGQRAWDDSALRLARDIGWTAACAPSGVAPTCPLKPWVRFVGYNGYPGHGDPEHAGGLAHLHVSWYASSYGNSALSPPDEWVRVFPIPADASGGDTRTGDPLTAGRPPDVARRTSAGMATCARRVGQRVDASASRWTAAPGARPTCGARGGWRA